MTQLQDPNYGHATAPRGIVIVAIVGMVLIALGTVYGSLFVLLLGILLMVAAFVPLIAAPEPERAPAPEPSPRREGAPIPTGAAARALGMGQRP